MPDALDGGEEVGHRIEAQGTFAEFAASNDLGMKLVTKRQPFAYPDLAPRADQRFPIALAHLLHQQRLALPLQKFFRRRIPRAYRLRMRSAAMSVKPSRKYLCIVEDHQVTFPKQLRKLAEPRSRILPVSRCTCNIRDAARSASGSCAISSAGR